MNIIENFKKKKRLNYTVLTSSIVFFLFYFSLWYEKDFGVILLIAGSIAIALFINIFRFSIWRCPSCNSFLGPSLNIDHCQNCSCSFTEEASPAFDTILINQNSYQSDKPSLKPNTKIPIVIRPHENVQVYN